MKKLIFVRHGRAEDPAHEISDFERSLTLKGKSVSRIMAGKLKEIEISIGVIITSPAFRALETAIIFAKEFETNPAEVILNSTIYYNFHIRNLTDIISVVNEKSDTITLFGHNPSFSEISGSLSGNSGNYMPKSGIICITFNIDKWSDIKPRTGKTEYFLKP